MNKQCLRLIDANLNRIKEGLRVCEDITRFVFVEPTLARQFKKIRLGILKDTRQHTSKNDAFSLEKVIRGRDVDSDVLRSDSTDRLKRRDIKDIFFANIQRAKEAARVLEEFAKLSSKLSAAHFRNIRFEIYKIEKDSVKKLPSLCNHR